MDALGELKVLARIFVERKAAMEEAEKAFSKAKAAFTAVSEEDIPLLMCYELGLSQLKLDSGETIAVKDDVYASITEANKEAAHNWLEENGFGGLIKTEVTVSFGRDEMEKAQAAMKLLKDNAFEPTMARGVHWQTLAAFLREQLANARPVPLELFGAHPVKRTQLRALPKPRAKP